MSRVSVIMPVRNADSTLKPAIESILSQSYTNFEFIIVDNGSSDNSESIIQSFDDKRIIHLKQPEPGLVNTLNLAIDHSKGEFIARMDADDVSHLKRLELQVKYLDEHQEIGVVSCLVEHVPTHMDQRGYALHVEFINSLITPEQHFINRFTDAPVAHPSVVFRKNLISRYGGYMDYDGPEDYELWLRWLQHYVQFAKVPDTLLKWRDAANRLSRVSELYSRDNFFLLKARYFALWMETKSKQTNIWVWGYGQTVFSRSAMLEQHGVSVYGYIDVNSHPHSTRNVIRYTDYHQSMGFVLVYVSDRKGKRKIKQYLDEIGCMAGRDYYFMS